MPIFVSKVFHLAVFAEEDKWMLTFDNNQQRKREISVLGVLFQAGHKSRTRATPE
jgi:hypothetical protein